MNEQQWDRKLHIQTTGRLDSHADQYNYPYEPTPYTVLERLAESGYIRKENILLDYGCGKGRVGFFLHHRVGCQVIGLEYEPDIYAQAQENLKQYTRKEGVSFFCENAAEFVIKEADCFYFFNPFSVEVLRSAMGRILDSYYEEPRKMRLFFYYPNDEYLLYLMTQYALSYVGEIGCGDLFPDDVRERILIFELL